MVSLFFECEIMRSMFSQRDNNDYPGIADEMEWNNKDPFYHRDFK